MHAADNSAYCPPHAAHDLPWQDRSSARAASPSIGIWHHPAAMQGAALAAELSRLRDAAEERDRLQGQLQTMQVQPLAHMIWSSIATLKCRIEGSIVLRGPRQPQTHPVVAFQAALLEALAALEDSGEMAVATESVREGVQQQAVLLEDLQRRLEEAHRQQACYALPTAACSGRSWHNTCHMPGALIPKPTNGLVVLGPWSGIVAGARVNGSLFCTQQHFADHKDPIS